MKCDECERAERCKDGIDLEEIQIDHFLWDNILQSLEEKGVDINDYDPNPELCKVQSRDEQIEKRIKELKERKEKLIEKRKKIKHYVEETKLPEILAKLLKREQIKDVKRYLRKVNDKLDEYENMGFK